MDWRNEKPAGGESDPVKYSSDQSSAMRKMLVVRVRKKFWLLAILTSLCLIVLNLLFSPQPSSSLLVKDNSVLLGESLDYNGFLGGPVLHKDPDPAAVTGVQIVGLDDLPAIKPMGCVRTKPILGGSDPKLCLNSVGFTQI